MALFGLVTKAEYAALQKQIETLKAATYERWQLATAEAQKWNMPNPEVYHNQADLYRRLSWVLQAVDITASAGALTEFEVKRLIEGKEPKDIPNHPFELLLKHPNPRDSRYEFLYGTIAMFMLTGNCYWYINRANEFAKPDELWLIPSHKIQPLPDGQSFVRGYEYDPGNGRVIFLEPWQVTHFRRFNPFNEFVGLSAIESIALIAQGDLGMQDWNTRLFRENNARLPGILTFEQMIADPTWEDIKDNTREAAKNRELLMLRGVGQGGVQWIQNAVSQKDMEFLAGREFNRDEIWNTLAPGLVSMLSASATEANSRNGSAVFNERTVYPKHVLISEKITNEILPTYGGRPLHGCFEDIRITDKQMEMDEQRIYAETHTIAEIRAEYYGDEPLGDERDDLLPSQINAQSGNAQEPAPAQQDAPNIPNPAQQEYASAQNTPPQDQPQDQMPDANKSAVLVALNGWQRKAIKRVGSAVDYDEFNIVPVEVVRYINGNLPACKTNSDVRGIFTNARDMLLKGDKTNTNSADIAALLEGIRLSLTRL